LLIDADTLVAANAAYALGVAKDTASVSALARAVAGAPDVVAREAAWALGEIGEPSRAVITIALGDGVSQPLTASTAAQRGGSVRAALLLSTVKLRPVPLTVVLPWLADRDAETVRAAAYVIGRQRLPAGVRALLTVRAHADEETRQHVARGLAKQAAGDSLATMARAALSILITDRSARVRMNAVRSVASYGATAVGEVERVLGDPDANVRVAASEGIQTVFLRDTAAWRRAWNRDTTFRVRQQLLSAARTAGVSTLASEELAWSRLPDWRRRVAALDARAADDKADRLALAREGARDADQRVRSAALGLIPQNANDADVRALTTPSLTDADVQVRAAALGAIARRARAEDLDVALAAHATAATEVDGDARTAALRVIAAAWARDSARVDASHRARLAAFAGAGTSAERRIVAAVTPMGAWSRAEPAVVARPLADYERLVRQWMVAGSRQPQAVIRTERGDVTIELFGGDAPLVVEAFLRLATTGYYRNTVFHRVVPNFVAQDGDARGDGSGGAGFTLRESYSRRRHERGAIGLATSGPDTGGSQYYLCHSSQPHLDGAYTVFGRVVEGFDVLDRIVQGDRMLRVDVR
jgi:cyclophilin family peptidyl-prolyl cis-trans isomerase/HEAT repeat protein